MYSGGLADGIWDEAPDVYVPGSILANWELCIVAGLQMEYGNAQTLFYIPSQGHLEYFGHGDGEKKKGFETGNFIFHLCSFFFHIPSASPSL